MIFEQNFTLAKIGEVVGKNPVTLRTHINRGLVTAQGPRKVTGDKPAGKHCRFSFFTLMEFAMAYRLYDDRGLQLDKSFDHARHFAHGSGGGDVFDLPYRYPALPFHYDHGETLWGVAGERSFEIPTDSSPGRDLYTMMRHYLQSDDFMLVNASNVFDQLCAKLRLHPIEILDEAYSDDIEDNGPEWPEAPE